MGPHALAYNNVNISTSIFVERTFAVVYKLLNACPEAMKLQPLMHNLKKSSPLKLSDLRPSISVMKSYATQSAVNISCILFKYVNGFDHLQNDPLLQNQTRWMIPHHKTKFHPLRASTIEEASTEGNLNVHNEVYLVQLQQSPGD